MECPGTETTIDQSGNNPPDLQSCLTIFDHSFISASLRRQTQFDMTDDPNGLQHTFVFWHNQRKNQSGGTFDKQVWISKETIRMSPCKTRQLSGRQL